MGGILDRVELDAIKLLEARKRAIFLKAAAAWHLKSWAIWLKENDANTIFFHASAKARCNSNSI